MENIVLYIVGIFFVIGIIDYMLGNKFKLGSIFESGINNMGPLAISMVGILSITPIISNFIIKNIGGFADRIGIDVTIISSSFIAIDMGAFNLAKDLAQTVEMQYFSGVLIASILGCTISFTLPLALGIIKKEDVKIFSKGILCGIITLPIGLFFGGLLLKLPINTIAINLLPIIILATMLSIGIYFNTEITIKIFTYMGRLIVIAGLIGLIAQGFESITGINLISDLMPIEEALTTVGKIAIFLGGAYVMIDVSKRLLHNQLEKLRLKVGLSASSIAALIGSLASAIIVFTSFEELDYKGKVICSAFSVGGAYVLGGQLGYVATEAKEVVLIYMFTKLLCGALAIVLAVLLIKKEENNNEIKEVHTVN